MDIDFRLPAVPADEQSLGLEVDSLSERGSYVYYQAGTAALTHLAHQLTALSNGDPRRR